MHKVVSSSGHTVGVNPFKRLTSSRCDNSYLPCLFLLFEGNEFLWGTITLGLSSSTHTFYKHRRDSSFNLLHHTVSHCDTMSHCHCTGWKQPQLTAFLTVWHHFYSLRAETVVRGREGHNEGKGHRKGHWKGQGKGEDEEERGRDGMR